MSPMICDIETLARPEAELRKLIPEWDETEACTRLPKNYSKPETQNAWLETDKANHGKDLIEKAALNAETATVAVVGFWRDGEVEQLYVSDGLPAPLLNARQFASEEFMIDEAFRTLFDANTAIGWNLLGFDLPMLIKRAWLLGVTVPKSIFNPLSRYPVSEKFVDTMKVWQVGNYKAPFASLNNTLKAFELPEKGDGKDFGKLWAEDRAKALAYNSEEILGQAELYKRIGLL